MTHLTRYWKKTLSGKQIEDKCTQPLKSDTFKELADLVIETV